MNTKPRYLNASIGAAAFALLLSGPTLAESPASPLSAGSAGSLSGAPNYAPCKGMSGKQMSDCRSEQRALMRKDPNLSTSSGSSGLSGSGTIDRNAAPGTTPPVTSNKGDNFSGNRGTSGTGDASGGAAK